MRTYLIPAFLSALLILSGCTKTTPVSPVTGTGTIVDPSKIESHLEKQSFAQILAKAKADDAGAQFELATMYEAGDGVAKDLQQAVEWYKKAAQLKNRQADFNLGVIYKTGKGVEQDMVIARRYFQAAEDLGEVRSAEELGVMYYTGNSVEQDFVQAKKHFEKGAMGQLPEAQVNLGVMYVRSEGMEEQDPVESYAWFMIAAENKSEKGAEFAAKLKEQLTEEQITKAMARKAELQKQIKALDKNTR